MNSREIGNIGEAKAKLYFIELGYNVFSPETINPPFDFIIEKGGICNKIEVKSSNSKNGAIRLTTSYTTTKNNTFKLFNSPADFLVLYHHLTNVLKIVKCSDYIGRNSIAIHTITDGNVI